MATIKTANGRGKYHDSEARTDVIHYVWDSGKIPHRYCGALVADPAAPAESMCETAKRFRKTDGVQVRHLILSFAPWECSDPGVANEIAQEVAAYIAQKYEVVYSVHEDKPHLHIHFVFNSISYQDGQRYYGRKKEFYALLAQIKDVLHWYGISRLDYVSAVVDADPNEF